MAQDPEYCVRMQEDKHHFGPDDMPSTREPSPEPLWRNTKHEEYLNEQIHAQGCHFSSEPSLGPYWSSAPQRPPMVLVVPKPVFVTNGGAMPLPTSTPSATARRQPA